MSRSSSLRQSRHLGFIQRRDLGLGTSQRFVISHCWGVGFGHSKSSRASAMDGLGADHIKNSGSDKSKYLAVAKGKSSAFAKSWVPPRARRSLGPWQRQNLLPRRKLQLGSEPGLGPEPQLRLGPAPKLGLGRELGLGTWDSARTQAREQELKQGRRVPGSARHASAASDQSRYFALANARQCQGVGAGPSQSQSLRKHSSFRQDLGVVESQRSGYGQTESPSLGQSHAKCRGLLHPAPGPLGLGQSQSQCFGFAHGQILRFGQHQSLGQSQGLGNCVCVCQ